MKDNFVNFHIDRDALINNLSVVRSYAPKSKILAMVKSNAYGHGLEKVVSILSQADGFGVSDLTEAINIRNLGIQKPIVLLRGFYDYDDMYECARHSVDSVIHCYEQYKLLKKRNYPLINNLWLKVNTGMNRLGFSVDEIRAVWSKLNKLPNINVNVLMTHFYLADCLHKEDTYKQSALFYAICKDIPILYSLSHSAGILGWQHIHNSWVRPGLMLYGISPFVDKKGSDFGLKPVMQFKSKIIAINNCKKGESIGYGANFVCSKDMKIGVIACGYRNGYPRSAVNNTPVLIRNTKVPLVGRVSMEMLTVDLSNIKDPYLGEDVLLWGEGLPIEEVSSCSSISPYELITGIKVV